MSINNIRNFCIIAHIDHGKSTLADRFLELTGVIPKREMKEQVLDNMDLERERGITIKSKAVTMKYEFNSSTFILNLIDTPGHVDFNYEVSRSLDASDGVILLVDATQGVQAQTLSNIKSAQKRELALIPVINKIDSSLADIKGTAQELTHLLEIKPEEILHISAKQGQGVREVLSSVISKVPPPQGDILKVFQAFVFDSIYDKYRGVVAYVRLFDGEIKKEDEIKFLNTGKISRVLEVGMFRPKLEPTESLTAGEIGYIVTDLKDISNCRAGDTITLRNSQVDAIIDYREPKSMVWSSFYPQNPDEFLELGEALARLRLNDASLKFQPCYLRSLGRGLKCGFLGTLHMDITKERLKREYDLDVILTSPSVAYKVKTKDERLININSATDFPDGYKEIKEPWAELKIITPVSYLGNIMKEILSKRGEYKNIEYLKKDEATLTYEIPLAEIIEGFYDKLKSISEGYASMSYDLIGSRIGDLERLDILVAGEKREEFSKIIPRDRVEQEGKHLVDKLVKLIPRHLFKISIQASVDDRIIRRGDIPALKKDVTAKLYGGDVTRKMKLRAKQKRGKKKMRKFGEVNIPSQVYIEMVKA